MVVTFKLSCIERKNDRSSVKKNIQNNSEEPLEKRRKKIIKILWFPLIKFWILIWFPYFSKKLIISTEHNYFTNIYNNYFIKIKWIKIYLKLIT